MSLRSAFFFGAPPLKRNADLRANDDSVVDLTGAAGARDELHVGLDVGELRELDAVRDFDHRLTRRTAAAGGLERVRVVVAEAAVDQADDRFVLCRDRG